MAAKPQLRRLTPRGTDGTRVDYAEFDGNWAACPQEDPGRSWLPYGADVRQTLCGVAGVVWPANRGCLPAAVLRRG